MHFKSKMETTASLIDLIVELNGITYITFIDFWFLKEEDLQRINKYLPRNKQRISEFALKVSVKDCVTNRAIGRIVLTEKR